MLILNPRKKNNSWEEPVSDTIKMAITLGVFLNIDYFTTLKGDKKIQRPENF